MHVICIIIIIHTFSTLWSCEVHIYTCNERIIMCNDICYSIIHVHCTQHCTMGDGYQRKSPHTYKEMFEGLNILDAAKVYTVCFIITYTIHIRTLYSVYE